jgi:PAS domain S-box-containing protein
MLLKLYVAAVALVATGVALAAGMTTHVGATAGVPALAIMASLLWLTEFFAVRRYNYKGHGFDLNLIEGVMAPLVIGASGAEAVVITGLAICIAETLRRVDVLKVVFNTAQWTLAAATGSLVGHAASGSHPYAMRDVFAAALAIVSMSVVNQIAVTSVYYFALRSASEQESLRDVIAGIRQRLIGNGASLIAGVTLVATYRWVPGLVAIGAVYVIGLDFAGRAYANVRADSARMEALQRATHALATSLDLAEAAPTFLAAAVDGFDVKAAELVLASGRSMTTYRCDLGDSAPTHTHRSGKHPLAHFLTDRVHTPTRLPLETEPETTGLLRAMGHERVLVVPLLNGGTSIGFLMLYDRFGLEGFEAGELAVASALGAELVGFAQRADLMHAIDEERRKLTDILENTSDGIYTVDADGTVTSWNNGLIAMTGYSSDEMVGTRHLGLLRARDASGRDVLLDRWHGESGDLPAELQIVTSGGNTLWLSCSYSRIPAAEHRREVLVVVARNITQQRELERLKDDFVAVVSHELRTPLVPIKGWAQTLINRGDRLNDDQRRTAVQSILAQAQKLESLVLNILEASRIESGRADGEGVADVAAIAMRLVEDTLSARPDRTVRVRPPALPCQVRGSAVWVERAVANLLANAIKYSPDDEPVDVVISVEGDDVTVAVTDRGPGIANEAQERIFERFERLEETRTQTGTGLGLYITRRLARAMGGDVSVSSVPGAGSTFLLRLPVAHVARVPEPRIADTDNVVNLR